MTKHLLLSVTCFLLIFIIADTGLKAQNKTVVFASGTEGYQSFRIPAIIAYKYQLLAFAEGRVHGAADFGDVDIVMKKSNDDGKTWSTLSVVVANDSLQAGNPSPVIDYTDPAYPKGRIFLFYNTGNNSEAAVRKGNGLREVWYVASVNGGNTWSAPVNITTQVHRPNQPKINAAYNFTEDWRSYANAPGHAIQIGSGKYKGRIFIPANHSEGAPAKNAEDYFAHGYFSDDHGKIFQLSANVPIAGSNESMAVALYDGRIMMNSRNQKGDTRARIIAVSSNDGAKWDTSYFDNNLPDPVCQGSILQVGVANQKNILAFCNAADPRRRDNLTLRISFDEGKSWQQQYVIERSYNSSAKDPAAYSDMVKLAGKKIGILYEREAYTQIVFVVQSWKSK